MRSDEQLVVRVGTSVSTEAMGVHRQAIGRLAEQLRRAEQDLAQLEATGLPVLDSVRPATAAIAEARAHTQAALRVAEAAGFSLALAEQLYSQAEHAAESASRVAGGEAGWLAGLLSPMLLLALAPAIPAALLAMRWVAATPAWSRPLTLAQRRLLNSRAGVALIRSAVMAADDVVGGALRVPRPLVQLLGDRGLRATGVASTTALGIVGANRFGLLQEGPARIVSTTSSTVAPPRGLAERVQRIPHDGRHQVRVERFTTPQGAERFEVYIGGTIDLSPTAGGQVLDMTSNAHGVAEASPASLRAVREAMQHAGVTAQTPVVVTGYSQGGLVAALLAASGDYTVDALIEVGAPSGQVEVPAAVQRLRLEHSSDPVTALGGDVTGAATLRIERDPLARGVPATGPMLPAHELERYAETAALADASRDERIRAGITAVDAPLAGTRRGTAVEATAVRELNASE